MAALRFATLAAAFMLAACAVAMVGVAVVGTGNSIELLESAGMSKTAAQDDMQSYYSSLDQQVHQAKKLAQKHLKLENTILHRDSSQDNKHHHGRVGDRAARHSLAGWYDQQQKKISEEEREHSSARNRKEPSQLSARAAKADLDSFFDSLSTPTNKDKKYDRLASEVKSLSQDLKDIANPIKELKGSEEHTQHEIKSLNSLDQHLLADSRLHGNAAAKAEEAAESAAKKAEEAMHAKKPNVYVSTQEEVTPEHIPNPKIKVEGLPPGWQAYMDRRTKHAYFYNKHTAQSTWINPKGTHVEDKTLPKGWHELKTSEGRKYFTNQVSGHASWHRPTHPADKAV
eukprot:CAMPEP_0196733314 /NCGR_PEP_ID=MMETSP1091-20130531/12424_1 /TAXON_ID=302021 /ORGANISM="Rhodomonas sp., Strain CCMP768" /LENGTH=341 /DNA_ID=CAMNT_0042076679 /DNA_START=8 /DNA_END=1033 /DNA_ORIENTATION=-